MSIGTLPPSLPSRHASLPSPFSLLPTPISPRVETSHHVVTSARDSAPVVAPSPVTTPDAMMSLTAIEHLDFEHEVPCEDLTATGESADYLAELAEWVAAECPELRRRMMICRKHFEEINAGGALHAPWLPPPARIVQVLR